MWARIAAMPNIASLLKSEISRVARKELRTETQALKKAVSTYRTEIASLKRRTQALEQLLKRVSRVQAKAAPLAAEAEAAGEGKAHRFSAKRLVSQRRRLGLSAAECGLLVGSSAQSIYNWEEGKVRPRAKHIQAIAAMSRMGKREVAAKLETLKAA